jgi:hypothetical protein
MKQLLLPVLLLTCFIPAVFSQGPPAKESIPVPDEPVGEAIGAPYFRTKETKFEISLLNADWNHFMTSNDNVDYFANINHVDIYAKIVTSWVRI